jgi:hypothetical protein
MFVLTNAPLCLSPDVVSTNMVKCALVTDEMFLSSLHSCLASKVYHLKTDEYNLEYIT